MAKRSLDPLAAIPPSRHPFQFWVLVACLITGWVVLLRDPDTEFSKTVPPLITYTWGLLLILSSTIALVSSWWDDRITGLLLERSSLIGLGIALFTYGSFILYTFGDLGAQGGLLTVLLAFACGWRCRHITRELRILVRLVQSHPDQEDQG